MSNYYTKEEVNTLIADFITNTVDDLTNYYLKSETYTQAEVNSLVGQITSFEVVATLPVSDIKTNVIYLVGPIGTGADKYEEWIYSNSNWVKIGETSVDLSNYVTVSQLNTALGFYTTTTDLNLLLQGKQDTLTAGSGITIGTDGTISADIPTVGTGVVTLTQGSATIGTFGLNDTNNKTIDIPAGSGKPYIELNGMSQQELTNLYAEMIEDDTAYMLANAVYYNGQPVSYCFSGFYTVDNDGKLVEGGTLEDETIVFQMETTANIDGDNITSTYYYLLFSDGTTNDAFTSVEAGTAVAGTNNGTNWTSLTIGTETYDIPAGGGVAQQQADWAEDDSTDVTYIKNKPVLSTVATSGSYNDLTDKPTIPDDLNDLTDVTISSPSNGQVLKYNSTSQKWENGAGGGGGSSVMELTQAQYDALVTPDPDTTYIITDADAIDMDDYALQSDMETVQTAVAGKADKQSVTANSGLAFPHWNAEGVITGADSNNVYNKNLNINGSSSSIYRPSNSNIGPVYGPTTAGSSNQIPVSSGSGAPVWANLETLTGGLKFWLGTTAQYQALSPNYDSSTLYVISD